MEAEDECRICRSPAAPGRPLRHPCACDGSIRFVHDDCQFRWLGIRGRLQCDVCRCQIHIRPLYAEAPSALAQAAKLLLPLLYLALAVQVVWEFAVPLAALHAWRLALTGSCAEVRRLFSVRLLAPSVLACSAVWAEGVTRAWYGGDLPPCKRVALKILGLSLSVVMGDVALAFLCAFVPFTLGRIILLCIDGVCYASTSSILQVGYGFILSLGTIFAGMHTFHQYLRGERLVIANFFSLVIANFFRSLSDIFSRGFMKLITVANISLNLISTAIICPLLLAWSLDICTSKIFGTTMYERFRHLFAFSYGSTSLQWLIGCAFLDIGSIFSRLHSMILWPEVASHFAHQNVNIREPFYEFYMKKVTGLFLGITLIAVVILVPTQIAGRLAPGLFPVDITYFGCPITHTLIWPALQNCADPLCGVLLLRFLISHTHTLIYLQWLVKKVVQYTVHTRHALGLSALVTVSSNGASGSYSGSSVAPKDKHSSTNDAKDKRRPVSVHTILNVGLAWLTVVIFSSAVLIFPISVGRASLFAISRLPLAGGLKSNDLLALVVGFGIISTVIAASSGSFAYLTSGRTHPLALSHSVIAFLWFVIVPILIGLLVDLSLISPFIGPDDDAPILDLFHTWFLGWLLLKVWVKWVHWPLTPFLAYLTIESRSSSLTRAKVGWPPGVVPLTWFLRDIFVPVATRLLAALGVPYVLAKGVFPRFGYSTAANSAAYRLAWLGGVSLFTLCRLAKVFCVGLCHLTKVFCVGLCHLTKAFCVGLCHHTKAFCVGLCHLTKAFYVGLCHLTNVFYVGLCDSIRGGDPIIIGQRLEDVADDL